MMKKSFSILLSFILLASHMYLTMGTHFCGGEAVEAKIMLGETHLGCGMMDMDEPCDNPGESKTNKVHFDNVPCCQNDFQTFQSTDDFVKEATQKTVNVEFTLSFIFTELNLDLFPNSTYQFYTEYFSPPLEKDIQVLFQTFLI